MQFVSFLFKIQGKRWIKKMLIIIMSCTVAGAGIDLIIKIPNHNIWTIEIKYGHAPLIVKASQINVS